MVVSKKNQLQYLLGYGTDAAGPFAVWGVAPHGLSREGVLKLAAYSMEIDGARLERLYALPKSRYTAAELDLLIGSETPPDGAALLYSRILMNC
jgi:hypothetical protein